MNINKFPKFKKLELSDREVIKLFVEKFPPYSDFDFTSLWSYDVNSEVEFSWLNENLVVRFSDYLTGQPQFSFLGNNLAEETVESLLDYLSSMALPEQLSVVPEVSIESLLSKVGLQYTIEEDPNQYDYIIPLKESANLTNINIHKVELYHHFKQTYPNYQFIRIDPYNLKIQIDILALFDLWAKKRNKSLESVRIEREAVQRILKISNLTNLITHGLYLNGEMIGYLIDERMENTYVLGHFIKADLDYPGIYELINQESAKIHLDAGYKYINIEQDLGLEGLRISKKQRSPSFFLKKYVVKKTN